MTSQPLSLWRVIQTDYLSSVVTMIPLVLWGMYYLLPGVADQPRDPLLGYAALALIIPCGLILVWRWRFIAAVFEDGERVPGIISKVYFHRGRGRVLYTYTYLDETYQGRQTLLSNSRTSRLCPGQQVTIVLSRTEPKRAFVQDIYL